jgi:hypothetical protein
MATDLTKLNKIQLEELGREYGIELDRRKTKAKLVSELREVVGDTNPPPAEPTLLTEEASLETNVKVLRDETNAIVTFPDRSSARSVGHKKGGRAYNLNGNWVVKLY